MLRKKTNKTPTIVSVIILISIVITRQRVSAPAAPIHRLPLVSIAGKLGHVRSGMVIGQGRTADVCVSTVDVLAVSCWEKQKEKIGKASNMSEGYIPIQKPFNIILLLCK